jgi:conjugative relaxase-like TrwC/TraI family protein
VTISIRRMSLGSGYKYLMDSVARGDGAADQSSPLTRYYADSGTPPGQFLGAGLAGLDNGNGVRAGTAVSEEQLFRMLGMLQDPITGAPLGRAPKAWPTPFRDRVAARMGALPASLSVAERDEAKARIHAEERAAERKTSLPVAGFDLTFSVPKSISAAWALADAGTQAVIYDCHQRAIQATLAYAEREVLHSRSGTNGVVQEDIRGVVAAGFDHWDSRAGDPQLHTHVVILNRAQSADGTWRTIDSRGLFKHVVTLSEMHEGILSDLLTDTLGWGFDPRQRRYSFDPKHEVTGVGDELMREFSQRSAQIEDSKNQLIEQFIDRYGRHPTTLEVVRLRQQATLDTRADKHHHSLAELTADWRARAKKHIGTDPVAWLSGLKDRNELPLLRRDDLHDEMLREAGNIAALRVSAKRATFSRANILAEVHRQLHGVRFASPEDRLAVAERTTDLALADVLMVSAPELHHTPGRFRRADGTSRFRGKGAEVYTTHGLLDAEARLLTAGRDTTAPTVGRWTVAEVCQANLPGKGDALSSDQAVAVERIATSGRLLDVLVGPAGTGKSTTMGGLKAAWEAGHGPGSVVGLAPSAAAAEVLADELGVPTENTAKWLTETAKEPNRLAEIDKLRTRLHRAPRSSSAAVAMQTRIDTLTAEVDRCRLRPAKLVIVDEASLAGTFALDALTQQARDAGAKLLLVGDWAQLSAVEAGGAFSMLVRDRDLAPELSDVRRFTNHWEKAASIDLRVGHDDALTAYNEHERIIGGGREELLDTLYTAWKHDTDAGKTSLMIAGDTATVAELNNRARGDRIAAGHVNEAGLDLANGVAGIGDRVVTRENNRRLATGTRWVKNGDQWTVIAISGDGSMIVQRAAGGGGSVVLPADYVKSHVELGYASTAHRAQGRTVDTAHAMIAAPTEREVLYVAATRGRDSNMLYVDTQYDPDADTSHGPVAEQDPLDVLRCVLANIGAEQTATESIRASWDTAESMVTLAAEYQTIAKQAQAERWDILIQHSGLTPAQAAQVRGSEAYDPLLAAFRTAESRGLDVETAFPKLVRGRALGDAEDIASVLHGRTDRWIAASGGRRQAASNLIAGMIPAALGISDPDMHRALTQRQEAMEHRARTLAERAVQAREPWAVKIGRPPADPLRRQAWLREVATVAAYRDRWNATGRTVLPGGETAGSIERLGHYKRAKAAAERALAISRNVGNVSTQAHTQPEIAQHIELQSGADL